MKCYNKSTVRDKANPKKTLKKFKKSLDKHKSVCYNKDTIKEGNDNLPKGSERK